MGEGFKKQKRKFVFVAIMLSVVCGLSVGLLAFGAVCLTLKLIGIPLDALYYVIITVGSALIAFGVAFVLIKPSDRKIAYQLDVKYGLNEKVQTALAYYNEQGAVIDMLHADTDERLQHLPKRKIDFSKVWQYLVIAVLSVGLFVSSLFVPSNYVAEGDGPELNPDAPFVFTLQQMEGLQALVEDVKSVNVANALKNSVADEIDKLINNLQFAEYNSDMMEYVKVTAQTIQDILKTPLSYKAIANALGKVGQNELAKIVAEGAQAYKDQVIVDYAGVESFYSARLSLVNARIEQTLTEFFVALGKEVEAPSEDEAEQGAVRADDGQGEQGEQDDNLSVIAKTIADIYMALNLAEASASDNVGVVLTNFAESLVANDNKLNNYVEVTFELNVRSALSQQAYMLAINKYVTNRLYELFGLNIPADENFVPTYTSQETGSGNKGDNLQGGYGKGDMLYGSDDEVYDPISGEYVTYGQLFNEYYSLVEQMLREGNLTDEQKDIINAYFEILLSGLKED